MTDLKIYIGYDSREDIAYKVAEASIKQYTKSIPIYSLKQHKLREEGLYYRPIDALASTEFTITRFLTPYLSKYEGWSLFVDCDVLLLEDITSLFALRDDKYAVQVVKHNYSPTNTIKMDGATQTVYPRKNWSSVILFNNSHPENKKLTIEYINTATPAQLHRFTWLEDSLIGKLPIEWNWLVGWYKETESITPKLLHYTEGGPWFSEYKDCEYSDKWQAVYNSLKEK